LELQGFYERGIFIPRGTYGTAKKRYALVDKNGNLLIRGLETVRRDWCNLAKEVQRKVLEFALKEKNIDGAKEYVKKVINDLRKRKVELKDLIIYEELTKPIEQYKLKQRGIEVGEGQVIMFVIQEGPGSISEKAEPFEFANLEKIDLDYYIGHQILPAAMRILQVLGVSENELIK
jgi:DNA polymerase I/DNA polymerase-2